MRRLPLMVVLLASVAWPQELKFAADRPLDLLHLRLEARVDLEAKTLKGTASLSLRALRRTSVVRLDAVGLSIEGTTVLRGLPPQPQKAQFSYDGKVAELSFPQPLERGETLRIDLRYTCTDPEQGLHFYGPSDVQPDVPYQVWSQGETVATRYWIPIFDHPDERLTSELIITADGGQQVLSNGRLVERRTNEDGTVTVHWKQETDHVPYLITLVVGKFAVARDTWRGRDVEYWVAPDRKEDIARSFANTTRMMDFFSDRIGYAYPWSKYAQVVVEQFGWGGMENTSATTLNERTLHDERASLDYSSDGLVAHELAHQWFGDLLTCRDWAHTWLNEGFASYFQALWTEQSKGNEEFLHDMLGKSRGAIGGGKKLPVVHRAYSGPWQQFDSRAYPKGAWILHMLRRALGDDVWWESIAHYVKKNAHRGVETSDLRKAFEETTGRSLERFFHDWTARPGHPVVDIRHSWDAATKLAELHVKQKQNGDAFHFPLRVEFLSGKTFTVNWSITGKDERFFVALPSRPTRIRVDPEFAVLMELTEHKGRDQWIAQLREDPSVIGRIRAAAHLGASKSDADRKALAAALPTEPFWGVQAEIAKALGASGGTICRDALLAGMTIKHPKARKAVMAALGKFRGDDKVKTALGAVVAKGDASYYVEAAAVRSWAALWPEGGVKALEPLLERKSHNEVIRQAVLESLGDQLDPAATQLLVRWTKRGQPRRCRQSALKALGTLARAGVWNGEQTREVVKALTLCLNPRESRRIKTAATGTLRALGEKGAAALPALEALASRDPNDRVRESATEAIERIRDGAPARLELKRLRDELRKLRESEKKLRRRMDQIEHKQPAPD